MNNITEFYDIDGDLVAQDHEDICAKKIIIDNQLVKRTQYFVKMDKSGRMFSSVGLVSENTLNKSRRGEKMWQFREVKKDSFENYMKFLITRNELWLRHAERGYI